LGLTLIKAQKYARRAEQLAMRQVSNLVRVLISW
jgi:hypothetical protein